MEIPAYRYSQDRLQAFLFRTCDFICTSHPTVLYDTFGNDGVKLTHFQHKRFCHLLLKNVSIDRPLGMVVLYRQYEIDVGTQSDIVFLKDLRDKYSHLNSKNTSMSSMEQLGDLLVVQRVVRALLRIRDQDENDKELISA